MQEATALQELLLKNEAEGLQRQLREAQELLVVERAENGALLEEVEQLEGVLMAREQPPKPPQEGAHVLAAWGAIGLGHGGEGEELLPRAGDIEHV